MQTDFYKNTVNLDAFGQAVEESRHALCYNGDICTTEDYIKITERFPNVERVMIGRGILRNPGLIGEIRAQKSEAGQQELTGALVAGRNAGSAGIAVSGHLKT